MILQDHRQLFQQKIFYLIIICYSFVFCLVLQLIYSFNIVVERFMATVCNMTIHEALHHGRFTCGTDLRTDTQETKTYN